MGSPVPCPSCGRETPAEHVFCGGCGAQVRDPLQVATVVQGFSGDEIERCASCNAALEPSVSFCTSCGAPRRATDSGLMYAPTDDLQKRLEAATEGEYRILSHLGRGGMGSVFLALDLSLHRHVAIKVMAPVLVQDATMQERFRTEARIVATLRHQGIVNIHGLRIVNDLYFFVMDYVAGDTLQAVIRAKGPLAIDVVRAVMYDVGSALQHAHLQGGAIIHRDVKPSNVILQPKGHAVVMDFGISKAANARSGLTMTGMVVGTPEYMSPEQCRGGRISAASDQYSLGLVGYAMLAGAPPFTGQHWSVLAKQTNEEPVPVQDLRADCPDDVAETIHRMLAKSERDRWPDVLTAVKALGGRPYEDGAPGRLEMGKLVESGPKAVTPVVSLDIEGFPEETETGEVVSITVTPLDGVGRALPDRQYTLESTDPTVLEVVDPGAVRALHEGSASIIVRCEGAEASRALLVTPPPAASLRITAPPEAVRAGDKILLHATVVDRRGRELEGRTVVWASSEPTVAEVSRDGELVARSTGTATVFATSEGHSATLTLEVLAAPVKPRVERSPRGTDEPARPGRTAPVRAVAVPRPEAARAKAEPRPRRSTGALRAAAIVVALAAGGLWAYSGLAPGLEQEGVELSVLTITRDGMPIGEAIEVGTGERLPLAAEALDADGLPVAPAVEWSSSDPAIVQVDEAGGLLALVAGSATLLAEAGGVRLEIPVRVTDPGLSLAVSVAATGRPPPDPLALDVGQSAALVADVVDSQGAALARPVSWASSDPSVALVDEGGTVRAISAGSAALSIASGELRQTIAVSVRTTAAPAAVANLTVRRADNGAAVGDGLALQVGGSVVLLAQAVGPGGSTLTGFPVDWASSDPSVASITADGLLRAAGSGSARISARAGDFTRQMTVAVQAPPPGTLVVTVRPWAYVSVDGVRQGEDQRRLEMSLAPGTHRLSLENPAMATVDTTVVIRSGETTTVDRLMTPGGD